MLVHNYYLESLKRERMTSSALLCNICLLSSSTLHASYQTPYHSGISSPPLSSCSLIAHAECTGITHSCRDWRASSHHHLALTELRVKKTLKAQNSRSLSKLESSNPDSSLAFRSHGNQNGRQRKQRKLITVVRTEASSGGPSQGKDSAELYGKIERVFADTARQSQGSSGERGRWEEVAGAWVLRPKFEPKVIVHFIGGAFVGASPQLTYRLFLERLSERGVLVVATPFASGFDHLRIADEAQFKFDRCVRMLGGEGVGGASWAESLPVFGVGHSMGALTHMLIGARYAVQRRGNVLISFNNKEATRAIPLFSPVIVPMAQNLGPLIAQLTASPGVRLGAEMAIKQLRNLSPPILKQVLPLVDQLPPLYADLANGKDEFTPTPDETRRLIKTYYGIGRNLLIRFQDDTIDETPELAEALSRDAGVSGYLDLSIRTLPGDHARPLQQGVPELPPGVADAVSQGGELLASLTANMPAGSPLAQIARGVGQLAGSSAGADQLRKKISEDMELLVDEIVAWMGTGLKQRGTRGTQMLPGSF